MANLPESSTFDAGVYQIETTDPVVGGASGVTNTPLKNLTNRTKYLKDHVDAIEAAYAPKASPTFTGTPTAPTPVTSDNSTKIATTAFVRAAAAADSAPLSHVGATGTAHGNATTSVAGFMSAADKTKLDGVAAGAQVNSVTSVAGKTGAVTLAVGDVSGAAPIASPAFSGSPTAPTPGTGVRSTAIATMQKFSDEFPLYGAANGYQKLPSGLIIQWAIYQVYGGNGDNGTTCTLPISFPNAFLQCTCGDSGAMAYQCAAAPLNTSQIKIWARNVAGNHTDAAIRIVAFGY